MEEKPDEQKPAGLNRRKFIGALGAAAAAGTFLEPGGGDAQGASSTPVMYLDSYGNVVPASPAALAAGTLPPPVPSSGAPDTDTTYVTPGYSQPNILMIMVDQMRAPRWVPSNWTTSSGFEYYLPHIWALQNQAYVFPNFFPAATACSPCRATLQTGLYSQQTCMFQTLSYGGPQPTLVPYVQATNTGYPTIGNVLSQNLSGGTPYKTVWIGKWHLSANNAGGIGGPTAYGYTDTEYCIPNTSTNPYNPLHAIAYPSPDGSDNEGSEGALLTGSVPPSGQNFPSGHTWNAPSDQLEDGAIADAFVNTWLPHAVADLATTPWFAAVSFVNPHDMSHFPYAYGLTINDPTDFGTPTNPPTSGYLIPPTTGYDLTNKTSDEYIPALPTEYTVVPTGPLPGGATAWNNSDNPANQPYGTYVSGQGYGKPTEQWYFQSQTDKTFGAVINQPPSQPGWLKFLNYYLWMQSCVDAQVGRVLTALNTSQFVDNTVILFLSDHGDYAGSHYMHRKGGGLYDEVINVPLYISIPSKNPTQVVVPYLCSTVDILPFLYALVLGNESWRKNPNDLVYYLLNRESIADFIFGSNPTQRRLTTIPNSNQTAYLPYVLHTCDEDLIAYIPNTTTQAPSHAIGFRTVDITVTPYGGGKLGTYSYWPSPCTTPFSQTQTKPLLTGTPATPAQEFEFYFYSPYDGNLSPNPQETGNQAFTSTGAWEPEAATYNNTNNFQSATVQGELYTVPSQTYIQSAYTTALAAFLNYAQTVLYPNGCPS